MKKEKRELTLEQLKKRRKIFDKISAILSIIALIGCVIIAFIIILTFNELKNEILLVYPLHGIFFLGLAIISNKISLMYKEKIQISKKAMKVAAIKEKAKEGKLKKSVIIKKTDIIENILNIGIEKIVIQAISYEGSRIIQKDASFTASIYLKDGHCLSPILISNRKVNRLLNPKLEENILDLLITDIDLHNEVNDEIELSIIGKDEFIYYEESGIKDDELLEIFDLKEE